MKKTIEWIEENVNRLLFAVIAWMIGFILIHSIIHILASGFVDNATWLTWGKGSLCIWFVATGSTVHFFLVSVPEYAALVTVSALTGNLHAYLTGMHFRFPWEQTKKENYVSTELITVPFKEHFPTRDGGVVAIGGSYEYRVDKRPENDHALLKAYVGIEESTIVTGIYNLIQSVLTKFIGNKKTSNIKDLTTEIQDALDAVFGVTRSHPAIDKVTTTEERYGITVGHVRAGNVEYIGETQTALSAALKSGKTIEAARRLSKMKQADIDNAMTMVGTATKEINRLEIGGLEHVTPEMTEAAVLIARAFLSTRGGGQGRRQSGQRPQNQGGGQAPVATPAPVVDEPAQTPTTPVVPQGGLEAGPTPFD